MLNIPTSFAMCSFMYIVLLCFAYFSKKRIKSDENKIYSLLCEASVFSNYGVSSEEIIKETGVSKRTLIYSLNKLRDNSLLIETKIGKFSYYKLSNNL